MKKMTLMTAIKEPIDLQEINIMKFFWYFKCFPFWGQSRVHTFGPFSHVSCTSVMRSSEITVTILTNLWFQTIELIMLLAFIHIW